MNLTITQKLTALLHPTFIFLFFLRKLPLSWLFEIRMHIDGVDRPYYAYGLYQSALEAQKLKISRISAYEFGVAGGHGLMILERLAEQITKLTGVNIDVYGFDLAVGLPTPADYRDAPYIWQKGFYKMDVDALRSKLSQSTKLVLGDLSATIPTFIKTDFSPIGFIAFDVDYYTSTNSAFHIFDAADTKMLPRVFCYFDDIIGTDEEIMCEYVGELLSMKEFNEKHPKKKIAKINGMFHKRVIKSTWSDMIYVMHNFGHKEYNTYVYPSENRQNILG